MFSKVVLVAVALLLASPSDDCSAATKKKKRTPIENSESSTRGIAPTTQSDSYRGGGNPAAPQPGLSYGPHANQPSSLPGGRTTRIIDAATRGAVSAAA